MSFDCARRRTVLSAALTILVGGLSLAGSSLAQSGFPDKPIRLIVPFPPGGTSDITGRVLADALGKELGQPVVVENRSGAGGSVGARYVAESKADGYTLLLGTSSTNGTNSAVYNNLSFDPVGSFTPITRIVTVPGVLAITKGFPAKTYSDFVKVVRQAPGKYSYASSGNGGATHLAMEYFKSLSGLRIVHIPYRGTGPALNDVISGQVDMLYDTLASSMPHIKAGSIVPVALAAPERLKELSNVPTMAEVGLKRANEGFWNGILAPAGLPAGVLQKIHGAIARALKNPVVRDKYAAAGAITVIDSPEDFSRIITNDVAKWKTVVKDSAITVD